MGNALGVLVSKKHNKICIENRPIFTPNTMDVSHSLGHIIVETCLIRIGANGAGKK